MIIHFVLGPIGAGKSTYIQKVLLEQKGKEELQYLSADVLKKRDNLTYVEAREKMGKIIEEHVEKKISFLTEGTGQHDDMYDLFMAYKEIPWIDLRITYISVDLEVAIERNKKRTRVLSDKTVREVHERSTQRMMHWMDFGCKYIDYRDIYSKKLSTSGVF